MLKAIKDKNTYRIVRKIADGGMGSVYEAIQDGAHGFQKQVALKTLLPQLSNDNKYVDMFIQEAKLVANLVHENIVQIYQLGKTPEGYYIVMELVRGLSLHEFIRFHLLTRDPVPRELAVFIAARVARGLSYAHSRADSYGKPLDIVHRDVCPNNVLVTTEGLPKLTDFGIAVITAQMTGDETKSLMGKIAYMCPEQANKEMVDFRADIFALGAVFFELLTGESIRSGESQDEFIHKAREGVVEWDSLDPETPPEVRAILEKALAPAAADRYETTQEMARDLEYFIYKDGYGPTIQTLETYLRKQFAYLYQARKKLKPLLAPGQLTETVQIDATVILGD